MIMTYLLHVTVDEEGMPKGYGELLALKVYRPFTVAISRAHVVRNRFNKEFNKEMC